uniref:Uncharacterized protein n=1 Tax=Strix occidentalis caurina TaxID=311401 RepID=A0A8D0F606_STROC
MGTAGCCMAPHSTAWHGMAWLSTAWQSVAQHGAAQQDVAWHGTEQPARHCMAKSSPAWHSPAPTGALQAPRQLGGEEDVHQFGAVVGGVEAARSLLPGEVAAIGGARAVPEGRDVDDAGGRRGLQEVCVEQRVSGEGAPRHPPVPAAPGAHPAAGW